MEIFIVRMVVVDTVNRMVVVDMVNRMVEVDMVVVDMVLIRMMVVDMVVQDQFANTLGLLPLRTLLLSLQHLRSFN